MTSSRLAAPAFPGSLTIHETDADVVRSYSPPPPPNIPVFPGVNVTFDSNGMPIVTLNTDETDLPFAYLEKGHLFPDRNIIRPRLPLIIPIGQMWLQNVRSAELAQRQLENDRDEVKRLNLVGRAANVQIVQILKYVTGQDLPADAKAWRSWGANMLGITTGPPKKLPNPTLTYDVPLNDLPRGAGNLVFDPKIGYFFFVHVPEFSWGGL